MVRRGLLLIAPLALLGTLTGAARPAPVPRETEAEKIRRLYGTPEDPDRVCTFRLDGNRLRLTAAKGLRGLNPGRGLVNAPRTHKPVEGDFVATVRMTRDVIPAGTGKADDAYTASGGGGLLVWVDADTHLRLSRSQWLAEDGGKPRTSYNLRGVVSKTELPWQQTMAAEPDPDPVTFRVTRTGNTVAAGYSRDGADWTTFPEIAFDLPAAITVGVYVAHNFDKPLEVVFEPLTVEKPAKKE